MNDCFSVADYEYMALAIKLANKGLYTTQPNPRVGCVLVKEGQILGQGWHRKAGEPHAERNAIADAGGAAKGATAYVTLEPCCHTGRTPPCTDALIAAGVSRVVAAMLDPNPKVSGQGMALLQTAGVTTESGLLQAQAAALNPGFIKRMQQGLPFVRCKLAMSLDGRTAMASGESLWITDDDARHDVQLLRARSDAIVTGSGTVLADNPSMNIRLNPQQLDGVETEHYLRQPMRVIVDSHLATPVDAKILQLAGQVVMFYTDASEKIQYDLQQAGASLVQVKATSQGVSLQQVMTHLASLEINEVLIEAGSTLAGAALQAGLIDELIIYMAPHLMGDAAKGLFHLPNINCMDERISLQVSDIKKVGRDFKIIATVES